MHRRVEGETAGQIDRWTQVGSFGERDGVVEEVRILLQASTELVKGNFSNCQGRIWAVGHTGDRGRVDDQDLGNSVEESSL